MSVEGSNPPGNGEETSKELAVTEKKEVEELIPVVARLKARGYPDWRIQEDQQIFHPGRRWDRIIDVALRTVTEEQVRRAKEDGIQYAMAYVISKKADGVQDWRIESESSRDGVAFVKDALGRVTPEQVAEEVRRRPKPRPPVPEEVKVDKLVERLKWEPAYLLLPVDGRELAEGILRMRWDGRSYASIRYLLGDTEDYEYRQRFDRAWVSTNFVKSEMLLDGRQPPRQTARGRKRSKKNRENSPAWQFSQEYRRKERDVATMRLWKDEGKCVACGKPATSQRSPGALEDTSHRHTRLECPVCGKKPLWHFAVQIEYAAGIYWQTYCPSHRPHFIDRRRVAILAQAAYLRKMKEEAKKRRLEEKEKRELQKKTAKSEEPEVKVPGPEEEEESESGRYDEDGERERKLEDGEW